MNEIGLHILAFILSLGWFIYLWGIRLSAFLAGGAMYMLLLITLRHARRQRLKKREAYLRRRIGGELALERLLTASPARAHFEITMLLSLRYPMTLLQAGEQGMRCSRMGRSLLIALVQLTPGSQLTADHVLFYQRQARALHMQQILLCVPCAITSAAREQALAEIPVSFFSRDHLINLLGDANPATNAQLLSLGRRKRNLSSKEKWISHILHPQRTPRYFFYGLLLLFMYSATHLLYYLIPGFGLLILSAVCRIRAKRSRRSEEIIF